MNYNIITTTTNSIDGAIVEKYMDLVSTNVVVGTNYFSDTAASWTDLFGGFSDTYQSKLQKIYKTGLDNIKQKACNLGANAILGVKIDFDEISGKGKSMFMISVIGTAVRIRFKEEKREEKREESLNKLISSDSIVDSESLEQEVIRRKLINDISIIKLPSQDDWSYLMNSPIDEISLTLLDSYLTTIKKSESEHSEAEISLITNIPNYFKKLDENVASSILYSSAIKSPKKIVEIIIANKQFSALHVLELIKNDNLLLAIDCLVANKNYYSKDELQSMSEILNQLDNLPELGRIESISTTSGQSKYKYICPDGHSNDVEEKFCTSFLCDKNINGLTKRHVNQIESFRNKVDVLKSLMK